MAAQRLSDIDGVDDIARAALQRAADDGVAPTPKVYAVWYAYFSGSNPDLTQAVDAALAGDARLSETAIDAIHRKFFTSEALELGVSSISSKLESGLMALVQTVDRNVDRTSDYLGEVATLSDDLQTAGGESAAAPIAGQLATAGRSHVEVNRLLIDELHSVRNEVDQMRSELSALQREAYVDHLTQLSNRRRFDSDLVDAIGAARAAGAPLSVALADIDRFKGINDAWGHAVGDKILKRFADLMRKNVRGGDKIARFGGEEFALIMPDTPLDVAAGVADRIRDYLSVTRFVARESGQRLGRVTVSFGVAALRPDDDAISLIHRADMLLYSAKNAGRNQVCAEA